jgi:hypothetical protein
MTFMASTSHRPSLDSRLSRVLHLVDSGLGEVVEYAYMGNP